MALFGLLSRKRIRINENERVIALYQGKILGIYGPGIHKLPNEKGELELSSHYLTQPVLTSEFEKILFDKIPEIASRHLTQFQTGPQEVSVIERDGAILTALPPSTKLAFWKDAGPWSETRIDISQELAIEPLLLRRLGQLKKTDKISVHSVFEGHVGLLFIDGVFQKSLPAGIHGFWSVGKMVQVKVVDLRRQNIDVTGQELLTRDRLTIRVNVSAEYRLVDPVLAASSENYADSLYRLLQYVFRRALGAMTLDQILEQKEAISDEAGAGVRAEMLTYGVEVNAIELKDVILPGEVREMLNQVVAATKQAEANIIRRREETNATRSLLNTAKVMAENPVMLRLKELEALESIAGKVEKLTIHNGTDGLLNDVVRLREG